MRLVLASGSQARRSMLQAAGVDFEAIPPDFDEGPLKRKADATGISAPDLAALLASGKAKSVSRTNPDALVIGSDQVLECDGSRLSKVENLIDAHSQLKRLQGKVHKLHSAVACFHDGEKIFEHTDTACLTMQAMGDGEISAYLEIAGNAVLGSVGCYQIEGPGIRLFNSIEGSHFTIMGMPLLPLLECLKQQGAIVWETKQ